MSVTAMSIIFSANMPELKTDDGKTVPDSTAKFVLLALADHASEDGENAYIGIRRMCQKTNLSTSTVCNAINALRHNGFITLVGKSSKDTNNYTINLDRFHPLKFQPLESPDSSHQNTSALATKTNPSVNHQLTISEKQKAKLPKGSSLDFLIASGATSEEIVAQLADDNAERDLLNWYESRMGYGTTLDWWGGNKDMEALRKFLVSKSREDIETFAKWCKRPYSTFDAVKARRYPRQVIEFWPMAFEIGENKNGQIQQWDGREETFDQNKPRYL